jgi:hypothetical protein
MFAPCLLVQSLGVRHKAGLLRLSMALGGDTGSGASTSTQNQDWNMDLTPAHLCVGQLSVTKNTRDNQLIGRKPLSWVTVAVPGCLTLLLGPVAAQYIMVCMHGRGVAHLMVTGKAKRERERGQGHEILCKGLAPMTSLPSTRPYFLKFPPSFNSIAGW